MNGWLKQTTQNNMKGTGIESLDPIKYTYTSTQKTTLVKYMCAAVCWLAGCSYIVVPHCTTLEHHIYTHTHTGIYTCVYASWLYALWVEVQMDGNIHRIASNVQLWIWKKIVRAHCSYIHDGIESNGMENQKEFTHLSKAYASATTTTFRW